LGSRKLDLKRTTCRIRSKGARYGAESNLRRRFSKPPSTKTIVTHQICTDHELSRQELIADGESMGETEAGTERSLHIAHKSVGGMFTGETEPI
jgi:hypothetical protein